MAGSPCGPAGIDLPDHSILGARHSLTLLPTRGLLNSHAEHCLINSSHPLVLPLCPAGLLPVVGRRQLERSFFSASHFQTLTCTATEDTDVSGLLTSRAQDEFHPNKIN